jgi:outer membrane receptor protein involved in Fe transport
LLFIGDGGATEAQGPSKRRGFELSAFYNPAPWLTLHAEYTRSRGRLTDLPSGADRIPGAIETVIAGGLVAKHHNASFAMRLRHFGSYSLTEDNSQRANPLTVVNARVEYQLGRVQLAADLLNVLDSKDNEIEYFYASRLPGEPAEGIKDRHIRPIEPRQLRVSATVTF